MTRRTQTILYHTLPIAFWLLAAVVCVATYLLSPSLVGREGVGLFLPALLALICLIIIRRIPRHTSSVEECFQVALLLGIASCWMPTVLFLILPVWGYLIYQNLYSLRSFTATLIGFATVAVWVAVITYLSPFTIHLSLTKNLWAWIPTGAVLIAFIASTIARQTLRVR